MAGLYQRYRVLRYASIALSAAGFAVLAYGVYLLVMNLVAAIPAISRSTALDAVAYTLYEVLKTPLLLIIAGIVLGQVSAVLRRLSREAWDEYVKVLIGYIQARGIVSVDEVASKMGVEPRMVEEHLAKLRAEGVFEGSIGEDGMIYAAAAAQPGPLSLGFTAEPPPSEVASPEEDVARTAGPEAGPGLYGPPQPGGEEAAGGGEEARRRGQGTGTGQ